MNKSSRNKIRMIIIAAALTITPSLLISTLFLHQDIFDYISEYIISNKEAKEATIVKDLFPSVGYL